MISKCNVFLLSCSSPLRHMVCLTPVSDQFIAMGIEERGHSSLVVVIVVSSPHTYTTQLKSPLHPAWANRHVGKVLLLGLVLSERRRRPAESKVIEATDTLFSDLALRTRERENNVSLTKGNGSRGGQKRMNLPVHLSHAE